MKNLEMILEMYELILQYPEGIHSIYLLVNLLMVRHVVKSLAILKVRHVVKSLGNIEGQARGQESTTHDVGAEPGHGRSHVPMNNVPTQPVSSSTAQQWLGPTTTSQDAMHLIAGGSGAAPGGNAEADVYG